MSKCLHDDRQEIWDDGEVMGCTLCGAIIAEWPTESNRGWEYINE